MSEIWLLTKITVKNLFNFGGSSKKSKIALGVLLILLCTAYIPFARQAMNIAKMIGTYGADLLLQLMTIIITVLMVILSLVNNVSVLFFSKDNETLMHLPLSPKSIFISRTLAAAIANYVLDFILFLPLSIGVGIGVGAGPLYYVFMILTMLALPILPALICSFVILIVIRFFNIIRSKDTLTYVASIIGIGMGVLIYQVITKLMPDVSAATDFNALIESYEAFVHKLIYVVPIAFPLTKMIGLEISVVSRIAYFVCLVGCGILLVYLMGLVADKLYFKAMLKVNGYGSKKKKITTSEFKQETRTRGVTSALIRREVATITRTPIYVVNFLIMSMIPLFALLGGGIYLFRMPQAELDSIKIFLNGFGNGWLFILAGIICFTNLTAAIMYTKDGSTNTTMNYLPISFQKMFVVKVFVAASLSMITYVIAMIFAQILFRFEWVQFTFNILFGLIIIVAINFLGVFNDVNNPKIKWNSETEAAKQNIFIFVYMLEIIAFIALGVFIKEYILLVAIAIIGFVMVMLYKNESKYIDKLC